MDDRVRHLLEELSGKLCEVIAESPEVGARLEEIRGSGYSLYLLLDCKPCDPTTEEQKEAADPRSREPGPPSPVASRPALPSARLGTQRQLPATSEVFRINAGDLAFLRSMGIDPTRRCRPPKRGSKAVEGGSANRRRD